MKKKWTWDFFSFVISVEKHIKVENQRGFSEIYSSPKDIHYRPEFFFRKKNKRTWSDIQGTRVGEKTWSWENFLKKTWIQT